MFFIVENLRRDKVSRLVLGIDIGVTSVGYGLIDLETGDFVDYGVRLFKEATAKDNETRRNKRGSRRLISRRKNRLEDMRNLLERLGVFSRVSRLQEIN